MLENESFIKKDSRLKKEMLDLEKELHISEENLRNLHIKSVVDGLKYLGLNDMLNEFTIKADNLKDK